MSITETKKPEALASGFLKGYVKLTFEVTNVLGLSGIKEQVADRCYEGVNSERNKSKEKVCECSGLVSFGLKGSMVDNKASDPAKEEGQKKTNDVVVIHCFYSFLKQYNAYEKCRKLCLSTLY